MEIRCPYLHEPVARFLRGLPVDLVADLSRPPGLGDKRILRAAALRLGLGRCAALQKRAIQFG
jgi:hypothetical protein